MLVPPMPSDLRPPPNAAGALETLPMSGTVRFLVRRLAPLALMAPRACDVGYLPPHAFDPNPESRQC
jgi:hypothetical protein